VAVSGEGVAPAIYTSALDNLVRQFARPLDCLRELVQNSIDAGSPRIEVTLSFTPADPGEGVLAIAVRDFGEGMDEHVIDNELTRMFASSKAGDLSKIGRFGIGFTSVFAIAPEVVHVTTGRHGTGWELVFHADRSFDKIELDQPHKGTCVTLFKRIPVHHLARWKQDIADALTFWCEHCAVPVLFDPSADAAVDAATSADPLDPFAAFVDEPEQRLRAIHRPLDLPDVQWQVRVVLDDIEACVGLGATPAYRWYNGGLTLLSTSDPACLGPFERELGHLQFKVQCRGLEHTLTRDNVIQDDQWRRVVDVLVRAADELEGALHLAHQDAVNRGTSLVPTLDGLARIASHTQRAPRKEVLVPAVHGPPVLLMGTPAPECAGARSPLSDALQAVGIPVVLDLPPTRTLASVAGRPLPERIEHRWVLVEDPAEPDLQLDQAVRHLLDRAGLDPGLVRWCRVHAADPPFVLLRPPRDTPMRRDELDAHVLTRLLGVQTAWVNVQHDNTTLLARVARLSPDVAAFALLQGVFAHWDGLDSRRFERIQRVVRP
jgi:hypothetical protein